MNLIWKKEDIFKEQSLHKPIKPNQIIENRFMIRKNRQSSFIITEIEIEMILVKFWNIYFQIQRNIPTMIKNQRNKLSTLLKKIILKISLKKKENPLQLKKFQLIHKILINNNNNYKYNSHSNSNSNKNYNIKINNNRNNYICNN